MSAPSPIPTESLREPASPPRARAPVRRTSPRRLFADRTAGVFVRGGGLLIIAGILGILVFILVEVAPLARSARVETARHAPLPSGITAVLTDEYRTLVAAAGPDGLLRILDPSTGALLGTRSLLPGEPDAVREVRAVPGDSALSIATGDGRVAYLPIDWSVSFEGDERKIEASPRDPTVFTVDPSGAPVAAHSARGGSDGSAWAAAQLEDGRVVVARRERRENPMTGEVVEEEARFEARAPSTLTVLLFDGEGRNLYGGDAAGRVLLWEIGADGAGSPHVTEGGGAAVTALTLLLGDRSLVVGRADGSLEVWFPLRGADGDERLEPTRSFPPHPAPIRRLAPSSRGKGFLAADASGGLGLYAMTSERVLWSGSIASGAPDALAYAPKADGAFVAGNGRLTELSIDNPHPEVSLRALFGKVWYEGYGKPEYVWQSTGGTDDFEPKLSLTPLLVGTLKGTLFSMLLAVPLGVLAAIYASQFMHPSLKRWVKPTVEIMAALPSVVLGFLAGLWLAPRVEKVFPALLLMAAALPVAVLAAGALWRSFPRGIRGRLPEGSETAIFALAIVLGAAASIALHEPFARWAFDGNFPIWLFETTGMRYDQRNAIVVGLAMGFAVIPIIFAIAEDALSNVPRNLTSGSLALGATTWQTVVRIVVPTASPGIFAAIMIGLGRAVGETMIVLMATGNTPIMDWSPFNGFRTLSANIAVEIPEAPHGGTLYRTLFLAALLLFAMTFVLNTVAELVRHRLRKKYANL